MVSVTNKQDNFIALLKKVGDGSRQPQPPILPLKADAVVTPRQA